MITRTVIPPKRDDILLVFVAKIVGWLFKAKALRIGSWTSPPRPSGEAWKQSGLALGCHQHGVHAAQVGQLKIIYRGTIGVEAKLSET